MAQKDENAQAKAQLTQRYGGATPAFQNFVKRVTAHDNPVTWVQLLAEDDASITAEAAIHGGIGLAQTAAQYAAANPDWKTNPAKEIVYLRLKNDELSRARTNTLSLKVSEKKAVSVYGLGRFPQTLYKEQWKRLIAFVPSIQAFIEEHDSELASRETQTAPSQAAA